MFEAVDLGNTLLDRIGEERRVVGKAEVEGEGEGGSGMVINSISEFIWIAGEVGKVSGDSLDRLGEVYGVLGFEEIVVADDEGARAENDEAEEKLVEGENDDRLCDLEISSGLLNNSVSFVVLVLVVLTVTSKALTINGEEVGASGIWE